MAYQERLELTRPPYGRHASPDPGEEGTPAALVIALWRLLESGSWDDVRRLLHPDFVAEWPQSGERFSGGDNYVAVNRAHPAPGWRVTLHRVLADGSRVAVSLTLQHAEGEDVGACFYEVRDGLVAAAIEVWAERTQPPAWRAVWTDR